jgi:two-component sensor histidine kinase
MPMNKLIAYFQHLTLKELLAYLFFSFAIVLNALSAIFDFAFDRDPFAITQSISVIFNSLLLIHYLKYKNLRFATVGLSIVYSIEFLVILYFEHFQLHGYFFPLFLPLIAYLTLSIKESTIITIFHYSAIILLSIYAYYILHIESQAFTANAIATYILSTLFIVLFGFYYHLRIADSYYKLFNSNYQKEMALDEIHHRVRNNLTVINSMLGTQLMNYDQKNIQAIIDKNRTRIETIAKIHDILYKKNETGTIKFEHYVDELTDYLLSLTEMPIKIKMKIEPYFFPMQTMHQFGIIIHELVTNSIKYAFDMKSKNLITITLKKENEEMLFEYRDNGRGCDEQKGVDCFDSSTQESSLGFELIALAVKQVEGELEVNTKDGMHVKIRFPSSSISEST